MISLVIKNKHLKLIAFYRQNNDELIFRAH